MTLAEPDRGAGGPAGVALALGLVSALLLPCALVLGPLATRRGLRGQGVSLLMAFSILGPPVLGLVAIAVGSATCWLAHRAGRRPPGSATAGMLLGGIGIGLFLLLAFFGGDLKSLFQTPTTSLRSP